MTIDSFKVVFLTVGFLIPGFVWSAVLSMLVPTRTRASEVRFLEFLTLSCINHGLWSWALFAVFQTGFVDSQPGWSAVILFGIIFVSPVILGLLSGFLRQREIVGRFLGWLGVRMVHPIPRAWDWHFSRERPSWVLVRLKDGTRVFGLFHHNSFAADDPDHRDIYLEAQFRLSEGGEWAPVEDTDGVLILADDIAFIEFRKVIGETHDG